MHFSFQMQSYRKGKEESKMADMRKLERTIHYQRKMLNIQRLAGTPKHRSYNLAEHSYFVAMLFMEFARIENVEYGVEQLEAVMKHDFLEVLTMDLPYHVKNFNEETQRAWKEIEDVVARGNADRFLGCLMTDEDIKKYLNKQQFSLMKACDILELFLFCTEEIEQGNSSQEILTVWDKCRILEKNYEFPSIKEYMERVEEEMINRRRNYGSINPF